jgi:hypothetical protein
MDLDVAQVVNGYVSLTVEQQSEFARYVNEFNQGTSANRESIVRESISKSARRMDVGPVGSVRCLCCGR